MVTLGMDSQFVFVDVGVTSLVDEYPYFFKKEWRKTVLTAIWCLVGWLIGIPLTFNGGFYVREFIICHLQILAEFLLNIN